MVAAAARLESLDNTIVGGDAASKIEPRNTVEAELSVRFQVAVTLLRGVPDLSAYGTGGDPAVTELSHRITVVTDPARPNCSAVLTVRPESSEEVTVRVDNPRGQPATAAPSDDRRGTNRAHSNRCKEPGPTRPREPSDAI